MSAYYNENDPKAAAWLRELITAGHIAPGDVDTRSITEIQPHELYGYTQCHFFAGIGGWSLALRLAGWPDNRPVWTGSCPCQPFSAAGKQLGTEDERHLWPAFFGLINAGKPPAVFGEQVASAAVLGSAAKPSKRRATESPEPVWLDGVFADLESAQYACGAADLPAACIGAPHIRQRAWWVAYANGGESRNRGIQCGRELGQQQKDSRAGRLADSECNGGRTDESWRRSQGGLLMGGLVGWPTCSSRDWKDSPGMATTGTNPDGSERKRLDQLPRVAALAVQGWNTPRATDGSNGGPGQTGGALPADAALAGWPTPKAITGGANSQRESRGAGGADLQEAALGAISTSSPVGTEKPGALNPAHSRWLMGYPIAWDSCGATAMQSLRNSRRSSSKRVKKQGASHD